MKKLSCVLMVAGLGLGACSTKFEQDPLSGQPNEVLKGVPPVNQQKPTLPANGALRLIADPSLSMVEERTDSVKFSYVTLGDFQNLQLVIDNPNDFPGSLVDAKAGTFSWTPRKGVVTGAKETESVDLKAHVIGQNVATGVYHNSEAISVRLDIHRKLYTPEVNSISVGGIGPQFREGSEYSLTVRVTDVDSSSVAPTLLIYPPGFSSTKSLAHLVSMDSVSLENAATKTWRYQLRLNLKNEEFTKSSSMGGFRVEAVNQFSQHSPSMDFSTNVFTSLSPLATSWVDAVEVVVGQPNVIPFLIYDPKYESQIDQPTFTNLPAGATVTCDVSRPGTASCQLKWTPSSVGFTPIQPGQNIAVSMAVVGRNVESLDTVTTPNNFTLNMKIR